MRLSLHLVFLTFVLISELSYSAPNKALPKSKHSISNQNEFDEVPGPTKTEPTQITYPNYALPDDATPKVQSERPVRGLNDLNIYLGALGGDVWEIGDKLGTQFIGVRYIPHENFETAWDYSVDAHSQGLIVTTVGHRWYIPRDDFFESYTRLGFGDFINSGDGLGGLINVRHFKLMASFGISDLFELHRRMTGEVGLGYGLGGFITYLQIGYNLNWSKLQ
jgi:hypothetical protein